METTRGWKVVIVVGLLLTCSCRFKAPSTSEGQLLAKKGTFPNSLPAWVKPPDDMGAATVKRDGMIPTNYSSAQVVKNQNATNPSISLAKEQKVQSAQKADAFAQKRKSGLVKKQKLSPLDRIESVCAGLELDVTDALKTVSIAQRVRKYESLTTRCSASSDLWFWLAQDYQSAGRLPEAVRSFEQVLILDPKNQAAQALLDEVKQKANKQ